MRKVIYQSLKIPAGILQQLRRIAFYVHTKCWPDHMIGKTHVIGIGYDVQFGKDITLYPETIFEIDDKAKLQIGNHFTLSYGALIACHKQISIGNNVMIGEYSSVRDTTHSYLEPEQPYSTQKDISLPITIGNNVWIGRGCIILPGTIIEDGVIIGANSVVKGHLQTNGIFAGSPARFLHMTKESEEFKRALGFQKTQNKITDFTVGK